MHSLVIEAYCVLCAGDIALHKRTKRFCYSHRAHGIVLGIKKEVDSKKIKDKLRTLCIIVILAIWSRTKYPLSFILAKFSFSVIVGGNVPPLNSDILQSSWSTVVLIYFQ